MANILFLYRDVLTMDVGAIDHLPRARMPTNVPIVLSRGADVSMTMIYLHVLNRGALGVSSPVDRL